MHNVYNPRFEKSRSRGCHGRGFRRRLSQLRHLTPHIPPTITNRQESSRSATPLYDSPAILIPIGHGDVESNERRVQLFSIRSTRGRGNHCKLATAAGGDEVLSNCHFKNLSNGSVWDSFLCFLFSRSTQRYLFRSSLRNSQ